MTLNQKTINRINSKLLIGKQQGFTLIELAVVIAVIGILSAIAIQHYTGVTDSAERAMIQNMTGQLVSGAAMSTAKAQIPPNGFNEFVAMAISQNNCAGKECTVNISKFGTKTGQSSASCSVSAQQISCPSQFNSYSGVVYYWNDGVVYVTGNPLNGAAPL